MEGFLQFKIRPVLRRIITRLLAIVPAVIVIAIQGDEGSYNLLILSQVILSLQLPFAVVPLIKFTSSKERMGVFANKRWVQVLAWITAATIIGLNANLMLSRIMEWIASAGPYAIWIWLTVVPFVLGCGVMLIYMSVPDSWRKKKIVVPVESARITLAPQQYRKIGVALDFGSVDERVLSHAHSLGTSNESELYLFHIVEGVSGLVHGSLAYDEEARKDRERLDFLAEQLRTSGIKAHPILGFGRVTEELVRLSEEAGIDLLIMGAHGHRGVKDILFGTSISSVRHALKIPVLVVQ